MSGAEGSVANNLLIVEKADVTFELLREAAHDEKRGLGMEA